MIQSMDKERAMGIIKHEKSKSDIKVPKIIIMFIKAISQQLNDICPNPCYNNFQRYMCKENGRSKKCIQSLWQY